MLKREPILSESEDLPKSERLRNKCINEIINTEKDYIVDLETTIEVSSITTSYTLIQYCSGVCDSTQK
jgi:hypothetical protein